MIRFIITQLVMTMLNSNNNCKIGINIPKLTFLITKNMQIAGINDFILDQNDFIFAVQGNKRYTIQLSRSDQSISTVIKKIVKSLTKDVGWIRQSNT